MPTTTGELFTINSASIKWPFEDFNNAIRLKPDNADAYNNRGEYYLNQGNKIPGCYDAQKACALGNCKTLEVAKVKGLCH